MNRRRHLNFVETEHGQRHQAEDDSNSPNGPDILKIGLQLFAGRSRYRTDDCVGRNGAEHIDHREPGCPAPAGAGLTHYGSEQNRNERQHAGCETEQQSRAERGTKIAHQSLGRHCFFFGWAGVLGYFARSGKVRILAGRRITDDIGERDRKGLLCRRVADTLLGTALKMGNEPHLIGASVSQDW